MSADAKSVTDPRSISMADGFRDCGVRALASIPIVPEMVQDAYCLQRRAFERRIRGLGSSERVERSQEPQPAAEPQHRRILLAHSPRGRLEALDDDPHLHDTAMIGPAAIAAIGTPP